MRLWKSLRSYCQGNEQRQRARCHSIAARRADPTRFAPATVLVVDDSVDDTRRLARAAGAEVIVGGGRVLVRRCMKD